MEIKLNINGSPQTVDVEPETPLLWVLRDNIGLTGTKYGCGIQQCGACTVHLDGVAAKSCGTTAAAASAARSPRSKACRLTAPIRCSSPGLSWTCRNAAIASPAS